MIRVIALLLLLISVSAANAAYHFVPEDFNTIQEAINASDDGDTVLVFPGTYRENLNFDGKSIAVIGLGTPWLTIIDGGEEGPCVSFTNGETPSTILLGFTLRNGVGAGGYGGGVNIRRSSPSLLFNIIENNNARYGGGISIRDAHLIGGVPSLANIYRNVIMNNAAENDGGAVYVSLTPAIIANNTIVRNSANIGGALFNTNGPAVALINNIVVRNASQNNGAIYQTGFVAQTISRYNDVWENDGGNFSGVQAGEGTISEDPLFIGIDNNNFFLTEDSPCIDTGDPNFLPDFDGSRADMGWFPFMAMPEALPVELQPDTLDFGNVSTDDETYRSVRMTNENDRTVYVVCLISPESSFSIAANAFEIARESEVDIDVYFTPNRIGEITDSLVVYTMSEIQLNDTLAIPFPTGSSSVCVLTGSGTNGASVRLERDIVPNEMDILQVYPNPFNSALSIKIEREYIVGGRLEISDAMGRLVKSYDNLNGVTSQDGVLVWNPVNLSSGTYVIVLYHSKGSSERVVNFIR